MMIDITLCLSLNQRICAAGIMLDVKVERFYVRRPYVISEPRDQLFTKPLLLQEKLQAWIALRLYSSGVARRKVA